MRYGSSTGGGFRRSWITREVRDREREHRPERVHPADEVDVARQHEEDREDAGEDDQREPRRLEARVQPPEHLRQLPVARHRVGDPRRADHAGVRGDEEDRRREDADVDLRRVEHEPVQVEVLDEAEHRVVLVAALGRVEPEPRHVLAGRVLVDRQRRERDERQREVDREDGDRDEADRRGDASAAGRAPPRRGSRRSRSRCRRSSRPGSRARSSTTSARRPSGCWRCSVCGLKTRTKPSSTSSSCVAKSTTASRMFSAAASWMPTMLIATSSEHDRDADDDVPRVRPQRLPEDREVVRHEERRDGDRDHVVQHLRPRGPERDELVERVPREARRAARLGEEHRPLGVRRRGAGEDQPGDDEDERRQPERDRRGDAERVVDRRADVAVRGREERRRAEHALEPVRLPATPWHRRNLVVAAAGASASSAAGRIDSPALDRTLVGSRPCPDRDAASRTRCQTSSSRTRAGTHDSSSG